MIVSKTADLAVASKSGGRRGEIPSIARMQHERHADTVAALVIREGDPVVQLTRCTFTASLLQKWHAIEGDITARSLLRGGRTLAVRLILDDTHIHVLLHQIGRGRKRQIDAPGVVRLARYRGAGRILEENAYFVFEYVLHPLVAELWLVGVGVGVDEVVVPVGVGLGVALTASEEALPAPGL